MSALLELDVLGVHCLLWPGETPYLSWPLFCLNSSYSLPEIVFDNLHAYQNIDPLIECLRHQL